MSCKIEGITHRGEGVARIDGKAVFIPFAIPGEEAEIEITMEHSRFSRGRIRGIIAASPDRAEPPCPHYYNCGGCAYQHVHYEQQLILKKQVVTDALQRIGKQKVMVQDVIGCENPWYYRNKVSWHTGEIKGEKRLGYYQSGSRRHLPVSDCLIISPEINKFSQFLDCYLDVTGINSRKQVMVRQDSKGRLFLIVEGPVDKEGLESLAKGYPGLESLFIYQDQKLDHIFGRDKLEFIIGERHYLVSPLAFFQVNNQQTKTLYNEVKNAAKGEAGRRILDAYCGTGSIAIYAAGEHDTMLGVDAFAPAIEDACINASLNHMVNCEFVAGACEKVLPELKREFDTVILDPPRAGCHPDLIRTIIDQKAPQIIYVSCNPATLARDIKILCESSYKINSVQPVDMFPWTMHVETVVLIERK